MKVTKATTMGTCFGVINALNKALEHKNRKDLTILGQLVHNPQTVQRLKDAGIKVVGSINEPINTKHVMITAHGAAQKVKNQLKSKGFEVEDATCPLVTRVHTAIGKMAAEGYFPVVIGMIDHVEVKGIVGDLDEYEVIGSMEEIDKVKKYPRLGIVCQTTQRLSLVLQIVEAIKAQGHEEVKFLDTICKPTKDRQAAVEQLAGMVDIMIVIGGHNSSNTKKLTLVCEKKGVETHHVEKASEIKPEWFADKQHAGITAGASTPDDVIEEVYNCLLNL